jgi:UDPglucose 6-dehydrogenase
MKITVVGAGYVGLANAVLLARDNPVWLYDIDEARIHSIQNNVSPIRDEEIQTALSSGIPNLHATTDVKEAYENASYIIIATPTDYDPATNHFDTDTVQAAVNTAALYAPDALKVLRSTLPIGFTNQLVSQMNDEKFIFVPEFLREGKALADSFNPTRVVIGVPSNNEELFTAAKEFAGSLFKCFDGSAINTPLVFMETPEAEAVKLFSNTFLATRVAFFNELDTFARVNGYNSAKIIEGVSLDPRVGDYYNNPSFGYGGYCLPKDTKQLSANYQSVPNVLISSVVDSNKIRKDFIAQDIIAHNASCVGIHRLTMKTGTDDFRNSAILGIIRRLADAGVTIVIYEPTLKESSYRGLRLIDNLEEFKQCSDLIVANRLDETLNDVLYKVYSRDIFREN